MPQSIEDKIVSRIYGNHRGWAFSQADFADLGSRSAAQAHIEALEQDYADMQVMLFGASPEFRSIIEELKSLEAEINARAEGKGSR
jgi:hypothetical protein